MTKMSDFMTTYTDGQGNEHHAVQLSWDRVREILGHDHDGSAEDDARLVEHLRSIGAPEWIEDAEGYVDEHGWGLIGPPVVTPWQQLRLIDRDGDEITDADRIRAALEEFKRTGSINGVFFGRLGLPHEDEDDASTWGPAYPEAVNWTGF